MVRKWQGVTPYTLLGEPPRESVYSSEAWPGNLLSVPLSLSLLIDSPIRKSLPLSPVAAFLVPMVESNVLFGSLVIGALNLLSNFLLKLQLVSTPCIPPQPRGLGQITLTMPQLTELIKAYCLGKTVDLGSMQNGNGVGPVGGDEPLFPDNLSVSLMLTSPIFAFDGSPDTSFNVPLFEVPGVQGGLLIALLILIARYALEQSGLDRETNSLDR